MVSIVGMNMLACLNNSRLRRFEDFFFWSATRQIRADSFGLLSPSARLKCLRYCSEWPRNAFAA